MLHSQLTAVVAVAERKRERESLSSLLISELPPRVERNDPGSQARIHSDITISLLFFPRIFPPLQSTTFIQEEARSLWEAESFTCRHIITT